jgi:signal transduction histidine kinase
MPVWQSRLSWQNIDSVVRNAIDSKQAIWTLSSLTSRVTLAASAMNNLFDIERFMPHGHCYSWDPGILWTSVISDALIFVSYVAIPIVLVFGIMRKRKDLPFDWMFVCFGVFIIACGVSHLMEIITVWKPFYPISAIVKAITAAASVPTAIILFRIAPRIVQLPSLTQLVHEQTLRLKAEAESEAKDRFIAVLSHELRTPLTPVAAGLDLIEDELKSHDGAAASPTLKEAFKMVRNNLEMETTLINDLLDVSAAVHGKLDLDLDLVDLGQVLRQSLSVFQDEINQKGIDLDVQLRTDRLIVIGAAIRLHQVINNLLSNAIKYTPANGSILVTLESDGERIRLSVKDSGCGIDAESLERIFQPFEQGDRRTTEPRAGLGLGLTIARTIAESHQGRVIGSSPGRGQGAVFTLELPLAEQQRRTAAPPQTQHFDDDGIKPTLLLVEDHPDTLRTLAALLRKAGYTVETAESIRQAEPLFSRCEVLITDLGLPDGNGYDLMTRFKDQGGTRGIAISGFGQEADIARSGRVGFFKHFTKPIDLNALKSALRELRTPLPS